MSRQRDPAHILQAIVRGGDEGTARQPWKHGRGVASHSEALAQSARAGRIIDPARFEAAFSAGTPRDGGGEHAIVYDAASDRFLKLTKPGQYGAQGEDAGAYLQRWALHNRGFNDDAKFEGHVHLPEEDDARAVISQPRVAGADSTGPEQVEYLHEKGFHQLPDGKWIHPVTGLQVGDTITPGNAKTASDGTVQPIDLQIRPANRDDLRKVREQSGIGGDTLFASNPASVIPSTSRAQIAEKGGDYQEIQAGNAAVAGPATFTLAAANPLVAYHGTPHEVDRFSSDKIGTGEGAQVYGHGLYFAENPKVAEEYRKNLSEGIHYDGKPIDPSPRLKFNPRETANQLGRRTRIGRCAPSGRLQRVQFGRFGRSPRGSKTGAGVCGYH